jgi:hypothetical protein
MKSQLLIALLLGTPALLLHAIDTKSAWANARTVIHADSTRTESVRYPDRHEQREVTYDTQGVKIASKLYLLNAEGQTLQGNIYDGRDQLQARSQFFFDSFNRLTEQRMTNLRGEVFQRIMFEYDAKGNQQTPKSYSFNVEQPQMKTAVLDFTDMSKEKPGDRRIQGSDIPMLPTGGTPTPQHYEAPTDVKPQKGSFWSRLLGKDKKKAAEKK